MFNIAQIIQAITWDHSSIRPKFPYFPAPIFSVFPWPRPPFLRRARSVRIDPADVGSLRSEKDFGGESLDCMWRRYPVVLDVGIISLD